MFLFPVFDWIARTRWAQVALLGVAGLLSLGGYLLVRDDGVRKRERARQEVERARERAAMLDKKNAIVMEERINARKAVSARDHGGAPATFDGLSDDDKALAAGRAGAAGPGGR